MSPRADPRWTRPRRHLAPAGAADPVRHWLVDGGGHDARDRLRARQPDLPPCPRGAAVGKLTLTPFSIQEITLERAAACRQIPWRPENPLTEGGPVAHPAGVKVSFRRAARACPWQGEWQTQRGVARVS
jgi:hypothetical protein